MRQPELIDYSDDVVLIRSEEDRLFYKPDISYVTECIGKSMDYFEYLDKKTDLSMRMRNLAIEKLEEHKNKLIFIIYRFAEASLQYPAGADGKTRMKIYKAQCKLYEGEIKKHDEAAYMCDCDIWILLGRIDHAKRYLADIKAQMKMFKTTCMVYKWNHRRSLSPYQEGSKESKKVKYSNIYPLMNKREVIIIE